MIVVIIVIVIIMIIIIIHVQITLIEEKMKINFQSNKKELED